MTPLLVTLAAILAASPQDDQLAVEVIWTTSGDPDIAQFGAIADAAQVGDEVWVVDPMAGEIVALDLAGRVTRIVARRGEGPGELRSPGGITVTRSGGAAVHDLARQSLEIFDDRGRPTRRVRLGHAIVNPKGFVELPSGEFVIAGGIPNNCCSIHWFNAEGERQHSLLRVPPTSSQRAGVYLAGDRSR